MKNSISTNRWLAAVALAAIWWGASLARAQSDAKSDPAAWGEDHVGKTIPDYVTGDECLFCHRNDVGPTWDTNPHARTVRFIEPGEPPLNELEKTPSLKEIADAATLAIGRSKKIRFLKQSAAYGKLDMATVELVPAKGDAPAKLVNAEKASWDEKTFAAKCAGCHATAVEPKTQAFGAFSLDCYACHGDVSLTHTNDSKKILLSLKRDDEPRVIASICGQCHLRGGKSRSTGLPYPNQFIPGDNLFKDYEVDLSDAAIAKLDPGERHIFENIRDIAALGKERVTCLSCHDVHTASSKKHLGVAWTAKDCAVCHPSETDRKQVVKYERKNATCGY